MAESSLKLSFTKGNNQLRDGEPGHHSQKECRGQRSEVRSQSPKADIRVPMLRLMPARRRLGGLSTDLAQGSLGGKRVVGPNARLTWHLLGGEPRGVLQADEEEEARGSEQQDGGKHAGQPHRSGTWGHLGLAAGSPLGCGRRDLPSLSTPGVHQATVYRAEGEKDGPSPRTGPPGQPRPQSLHVTECNP